MRGALRWVWLAVLSWLLIAGCAGGGASKVSYPAERPAPESMRGVPVLLSAKAESTPEARADAETAASMIEDALKGAGYTLVRSEGDAHHAVMELSVRVTPRSTSFVITKNGKVVDGLSAQLELRLSSDGQLAHAVKRELTFTQGEIAAASADLNALVHELNAAPPVQQLGERLAAKAKQDQSVRHDQWREQYADACEKAATPQACDALERWLDEHRGDDKVAALWSEGKEVLEAAKPKLDELDDDALWLDARVAECLERATDDGCSGVKSYLRKLPRGSHAGEAQAALDKMKDKSVARADKRERDDKMREAAERQEAAAAAGARRAEQDRQAERQRCEASCNARCNALTDNAQARACRGNCQSSCP